MMRYGSIRFAFLAALALLAGVVGQAEAAISVDGDLELDWGIKIGSDKHLDYDTEYAGYWYKGDTWPCWRVSSPPNAPAEIGGLQIYYDLEDSYDGSNNYKVGPLYGGQNYDAEALLVTVDETNNTLNIAIVSGQRPDNGATLYGPGDIQILTDQNTWYGIEVGGGSGGASGPFATITEANAGWTYDLDGNGYTEPSGPLTGPRTGASAGSLWKTTGSDWIEGNDNVDTQLVGGLYVDTAAYRFRFNPDNPSDPDYFGQHSIIELSIPYNTTTFDGAVKWVRWAPACANDILDVLEVELPPPVPEPGSIVVWGLLGLAFGGCGCWRWRRRR